MKKVFVRGDAETWANYAAALRASGMEPVFSLELTQADRCDGLLLTGGADIDPARYGQRNTASRGIEPEREQDEFYLVQRFLELERPILGICRGHQILNVALGGDLIQHIPGHAAVAPGVDHVHMVTAEHEFLRRLYGDRFPVNSSHHQLIGKLGEGLTVLCRSDEGYIEGILHETRPILGLQFHPERITAEKRRDDTVDGGALFGAFRDML